jgi:Transposase DDE domain
MCMFADSLPGLKRFLTPLGLRRTTQEMIVRMVVAFVSHLGRMSCLQAAGSVRSDSVHRAQITRFLGRAGLGLGDLVVGLRAQMLLLESLRGRFLFIVDATLCSQQGKKTENTFSTGNRQRRPKKGRRHGKTKRARRTCHSFTMGLLITPSGMRLPYCVPCKTKEYCKQKGLPHRTTAEAAADLIRQLPLPEGADVVVLGDTAYDADVVREACSARGYRWIFPCNPERVLAGPKPRPKVRSLLKDLCSASLTPVRLAPGQGQYVAYRRLAPRRVGPKAKPRTFYVRQERRNVHSVGEVRLVFSTRKPKLAAATPDEVKILMTNDRRLSVREVVELYSLRWQIELFFKELKSTLGFHQYRFQRFEAVEAWADMALIAALYLEQHRAQQLRKRGLSDKERDWWSRQRMHGLCQIVRLKTEQAELQYVADRLQTPAASTNSNVCSSTS